MFCFNSARLIFRLLSYRDAAVSSLRLSRQDGQLAALLRRLRLRLRWLTATA
jgi:hypothetical protein